jgi:hypothetical protein
MTSLFDRSPPPKETPQGAQEPTPTDLKDLARDIPPWLILEPGRLGMEGERIAVVLKPAEELSPTFLLAARQALGERVVIYLREEVEVLDYWWGAGGRGLEGQGGGLEAPEGLEGQQEDQEQANAMLRAIHGAKKALGGTLLAEWTYRVAGGQGRAPLTTSDHAERR